MALWGVIALQWTLWTECARKANKQMKSKILSFPFRSLWSGLGRYVHIVSLHRDLPASLASCSLYSLPEICLALFHVINLPKITNSATLLRIAESKFLNPLNAHNVVSITSISSPRGTPSIPHDDAGSSLCSSPEPLSLPPLSRYILPVPQVQVLHKTCQSFVALSFLSHSTLVDFLLWYRFHLAINLPN